MQAVRYMPEKKLLPLKLILYREKALTMVELLIATALAGLVAAGAYSLYFTALQSWERGVDSKEIQQNARMAVRAIEQDIRYADWIWVGNDWENYWNNAAYSEPGQGEQLYYGFFADRRKLESRPSFTFNKIWLSDKTIFFRKAILLTELNSTYYVNPAPFPLADNIHDIQFYYSDETKKRLTVTIKAGDGQGEQVELRSSIYLRNLDKPVP